MFLYTPPHPRLFSAFIFLQFDDCFSFLFLSTVSFVHRSWTFNQFQYKIHTHSFEFWRSQISGKRIRWWRLVVVIVVVVLLEEGEGESIFAANAL